MTKKQKECEAKGHEWGWETRIGDMKGTQRCHICGAISKN